jgi:hypothetical protein
VNDDARVERSTPSPVEEPASSASIFVPPERTSTSSATRAAPRDNWVTPTAPPEIEQEQPRILASAVFVAGSARMTPGHRYGLALRADRFLVLGPTDVDPNAVVLDRPVAGLDVRALEGRLILSEPQSRSGIVLAFMAIAGPSTPALAASIAEAASAARND